MSPLVDIISVFHNDINRQLMLKMHEQIKQYEPFILFRLIEVDNMIENRGFARGCNVGASQGSAPIIGFLNPDVQIKGSFLGAVLNVLADKRTVITGERFEKIASELHSWGCKDWVCGAAFFVKRSWFDLKGGFDEQFVWGWEETDLIRQAQQERLDVRSVVLPICHMSPDVNSLEDIAYKRYHFNEGAVRFRAKWR